MKDNQILRAYSIKEVSRRINVPAGTIRQWEKDLNGVLIIPRSKQGARFYTEGEIAILKRIKERRDKNLSKEIIKDMLQKHLTQEKQPVSEPPSEDSGTSLAVVEKPAEPKMEDFLVAMDDYKNNLMKEHTVRLKMLPVCSCGHIFQDGIIIHQDILGTNGMKYAIHSIEPPTCPNCKKEIECIEHYSYTVEHVKDF